MKIHGPYQAVINAPGFALGIASTADEITGIDYLSPSAEQAPRNPLAAEAVRQIRAYLANPGFVFGLPLRPQGTAFQRRVWEYIAGIPCGRVEPYGEVARHLRSGPRAVGGACGANPYPLVVPCHRVVSTSGLGGFGGVGGDGATLHDLLVVKRWLLAHEGVVRP